MKGINFLRGSHTVFVDKVIVIQENFVQVLLPPGLSPGGKDGKLQPPASGQDLSAS